MQQPSDLAFDAIDWLTNDHLNISASFRDYEECVADDEKQAVADRLCRAIGMHMRCEEELLYPAAQKVMSAQLLHEAREEHGSARYLIARIQNSSPVDITYDAMVKVLRVYVTHHVREEEREIFPRLRRSNIDLQKLGAAIATRRRELSRGEGGTIRAVAIA